MVGLEIITDKESKAPNSPLAVNIMYSLKADEKTLVGISGRHRNVIFVSPPMCFTMENSRRLVNAIENVLAKVKFQMEFSPEELEGSNHMQVKTYKIFITNFFQAKYFVEIADF